MTDATSAPLGNNDHHAEPSSAPQLVIMAAGLGSRFGGVKQLAKVGPGGETILDFSIKDALSAGFADVVLIVRSEIEDDVREHVLAQHGADIAVSYVRQDDLGPPRSKPWGTLHAVLSAAKSLDRPFAVLNADDYYGPSSFQVAYEAAIGLSRGESANIVFEMGKTVPPSGAVSRGLVQFADGYLTEIVETHDCERLADGTHRAGGVAVGAETPVSMNFWCFHPSVLDDFERRWQEFLVANGHEEKSEAQLPTVVGELMDEGTLRVQVLSSPEQWIGITNPEDLELAQAALATR